MVQQYDYLVIGSGIAGMSFALKVAGCNSRVALVCKSALEEANTYLAQGGVASVTNLAVDNFEKHINDTMIAGDWLSDGAAVEKVVRDAPEQIQFLIDHGVCFDKNENGDLTCTAKAATPNSAYCTMPTTRGPRYRQAWSNRCARTPTSTSTITTWQWK